MVQPIDYMSQLQAPDLGQSLLSGIQAGQAIRQARQENAAQEQAQAFRTDLQDFFAKPTAQGAAALNLKYPGMGEGIKQSYDLLNDAQKEAEYGAGIQVYHALNNGNAEAAKGVLDEHITAMRNSGQDVADLESIRAQIERNPQQAQALIGLTMAKIDPDRWKKSMDIQTEAQKAPLDIRQKTAEATQKEYEAANTPQRLALENGQKATDIANLRSTIADRSARFGLDQDKYNNEVEAKAYELSQKGTTLDADQRKDLNLAVTNAIGSEKTAASMLDLASRLEKEGGGYGAFSTAGEYIKNLTGNQNAMSDLRKEYTRLRSEQVLKLLPPGPATDKDVEIISRGFPDPTADAKTISDFLRSMARLNQAAAVSENAKSEWINEVGNQGKTRRDITIDGVSVPAGTTFVDFSRNYVPKKLEQKGAEQAQQNVPNRSYMKYATGVQ